MNVCLITFQYPPMIRGGVGSATHRIAKNLATVGVCVHVIAPGPHPLGTIIEPNFESGCVVHRTYPALGAYSSNNPDQLKAVGDYIASLHAEIDFDLFHGMFLIPSGLVAAIAAREIGRPLIVSIRGNDVEVLRYSLIHGGSVKWVLESADLVTSVTPDLLDKAKSVASISQGQAIVNAFDTSLFPTGRLTDLAKEFPYKLRVFAKRFLKAKSRGGPVIGTTGLMRYKKGFHLLLQAFREFLDRHPTALLLLVGDFLGASQRKQMLKMIKSLGIKRQVFITGPAPHSHVPMWMRETDIFAFPSLYEGSPNALIEAMGLGLPIVASDISGVNDVISDGVNGLLVEPNSVDALLNRLLFLSENKGLQTQLGETAKQTIETQFSPIDEVEIWLDMYFSVCRTCFSNTQTAG